MERQSNAVEQRHEGADSKLLGAAELLGQSASPQSPRSHDSRFIEA